MNLNFDKLTCFKQRNAASLLIFLTFSIVFPTAARADIGLPMLIVVWPSAWVLLLPIILIEAFVATRILKVDYKKALKIAGSANLVSTIMGIPLTWTVLVFGEMLVSGGSAFGIDTFWKQLYAATIQSPWMIPYSNEPSWMLPTSVIFLSVFFFFMSVWVEYRVAKKSTYGMYDGKLLLKWSWVANGLSYGLILIPLAVAIVFGIVPTIGKTQLYGNIGVSGIDVYAFNQEQIMLQLKKERVEDQLPDAPTFFNNLPYRLCTSGEYFHCS